MNALIRWILLLICTVSLVGVGTAYPYQYYVEASARRHQVEPALIRAVMHSESNYNQYALSHKGAIGLMQLMITTAREYEPWVARFQLQEEPDVNIDIGTRHLKDLDRQVRRRYPEVHGLDRVKLMAAAYNAGWGRVVRSGGHVPPTWETRGYVRRVARYYQTYGGKLKPASKPQQQPPTKKTTKQVEAPVSSASTEHTADISNKTSDHTAEHAPGFQLTRHMLMVLLVSVILFMGYVTMSWSHLAWLIRHYGKPRLQDAQ